MISFKHLKRLYKNVCASKKDCIPMLEPVNFAKGKVTATNSMILYQYETDIPEILEGKNLAPSSQALENEVLLSMATNPNNPEHNKLTDFMAGEYPKVDMVKPDISKDHVKIHLNKDLLKSLLTTFEGEKIEVYVNRTDVNAPVTILADKEYGLIMPLKQK
jgi:hypothetical protein